MKSISIVLFFLLFPVSAAFSNGMTGTEFWFGFMENISPSPQLNVVVSSSVATTGTLSIPLTGWTQNFTVPANSSVEMIIPFGIAEANGNMSLEDKGIHLVSDDPVFLNIHNQTGGSDDATSVLPYEALGYEYLALTYMRPTNTNSGTPEVLIVAAEDNTAIEIIPSGTLSNGQSGPITVTLNRGQTYQIQSWWWLNNQANGNDLSGTFIRSVCNSDGFKHRIAVFSGNRCAAIGEPVCSGCDHLEEQMWPSDQLGTDFIVPSPVLRDTFELTVAARDNGTVVNISGQTPINLNAGNSYQLTLSGDQTITSNLPIAVGQFTRGQQCSIGLGDPFFSQIVPNTQKQTEWLFYSYDSFSALNLAPYDSYVNIVAPIVGAAPVMLDGVAIPPASFQTIGGSRVAKISIPSNSSTHSISSTEGFVAYVYGYSGARSYNYNSGIFSNNSEVNFDIAYLQDTTNQALFEDTLCSCESLGFISTFDLPGYEIIWDFGDGQFGNGVSVNHDYLNGTYDITMYIEDVDGCKIDSVTKLDVSIINCDITGPIEPICFGDSVVLSSVNTAFTYLWSNGETTQSIVVSPDQTTVYSLQLDGGAIPICDSVIVEVWPEMNNQLVDTLICETASAQLTIGIGFNNIIWSTSETTTSIEVNQPGTYFVQANDINGCSFNDTAIVSVQAQPQWVILGEELMCEGDTLLYQGPTLTNASYTWNTGENTQNIYVSAPGLYELSVNDGICISSHYIELEEILSMENYMSLDTIICADNFILEIPDLPGTDFAWSTGDASYMTTVYESGIYSLTISNQCETWTDSMEVTFDCSSNLYVPNTFTPNDDGMNDIFYAVGFGILDFEMMIFNRWGENIYRSEDISKGWDGMYRGEKAQVGAYTYKIVFTTITNETKKYTGHVSLMR